MASELAKRLAGKYLGPDRPLACAELAALIDAELAGVREALRPIKCGQCDGRGKIMRIRYSTEDSYPSNCPTCKGDGEVVPINTLAERRAILSQLAPTPPAQAMAQPRRDADNGE